MKLERLFLKEGSKYPDVVIVPVEQKHMRTGANVLEKLILYREIIRKKARLTIYSKDVMKKIGGFDSSLGFGEDRILMKKLWHVLKLDKKKKERVRRLGVICESFDVRGKLLPRNWWWSNLC